MKKTEGFASIELLVQEHIKKDFRDWCLKHKLIPHRVAVLVIERTSKSRFPAKWIRKAHDLGISETRVRGAKTRNGKQK